MRDPSDFESDETKESRIVESLLRTARGTEEKPKLSRFTLQSELRVALAIAGHENLPAPRSSLNDLVDYTLEHGLPSRVERERMLAERLAAEDTDEVEVR